MTSIQLNPIGTYSTGIFDQSAAEINAFDASTNRLFVVNANSVTVEVLDLSNPNNPTKIGEINATAFGGVANSVAVKNGIVAIAIEAEQKTDAGKVVFFASNEDFTTALNSVEVGALPDMLTFTTDGKKVLVANEGESDGDIDPNGSISIIDLSNGVENATVANAVFTQFNGSENNLLNAGVRIFPNKNVAQDVEPEYITISADQTTAYVSLQENNAIAIVDIATATVKAIMPLGLGDRSRGLPELETFDFNNLANLTNGNGDLLSATGETIKLGGFSGLWYEGVAENGNLKFLTIPDRGPNRDASGNDTVFVLPNYQARVVSFELNETTKEIVITNEILLKRSNGNPLTGLPNIPNFDQRGVDANGNPITNTLEGLQHLTVTANGSIYDPLGADLEGIVRSSNGDLWAVDEYRPAIYHFDANGTLINRFVPENTAALANLLNPTANFKLGDFGQETLPAEYFTRRGNRGFEGMALDTDSGILYAFIQTPLANPNRSASNNSSVIRMLGINPSNGETVAEYVYLLQKPAIGEEIVDKIGDAVYAGNGQFYIIERDSSLEATAQKFVYKFDLTGATNLRSPNAPDLLPNKTLEQHTADELAALGIGVIDKVKVTNLPSLGYSPSDKAEGLTILPDGRLAVLNDNDFGIVEGIEKIQLGLIDFSQSNGLDTSDRDNSINITNHPIFGMFMPDAIASYEVEGKTYIVTANEGDARNEDIRVGNNNVILDPVKFPNAAELKANSNLGRLTISSIDGDIDGDGDYDRLQTYGNRSFSIWDENLNLVFDSGDQFETFIATQIAADGLPFNAFNTNHTSNDSFDTRSDDKGIEPEGVTIGVIEDQTYAFIGLERASGIMVYNISNPNQPEFVNYLNNRNYLDQNGVVIPTNTNGVTNPATGDLGPEGLTFINAEDSPNGKPLLVVSNEVSGTTTIYEIEIPPQTFTLQILHTSDQEAGIPALQDSIGLSAVLNALDPLYENTIKLSSGDLFIAGPFFNASTDIYGQAGIADILVQNELGWDAAAVGNHEFDAGPGTFFNLLAPKATTQGVGIDPNTGYQGANFPYLATNLDYSTDSSNLKNLVVEDGNAPLPNSLTGSVVIDIKGEKIGVVGAVTPILPQIAGIGGITMLTDTTASSFDQQAQTIAQNVQPVIDALVDQGINKIILMTHLQQFEIEQALAPKLQNVDVLMGGGSHRVMASEGDILRADETQTPPQLLQPYPQVFQDLDGNNIYLINTAPNYRYLSQLVIEFDQNGQIINVGDDSGAYATDIGGVDRLYEAEITTFDQVKAVADQELVAVVDNLGNFINSLDGNIFGNTAVYLNGLRGSVRTEETNLGNLASDAQLWYAQQLGITVDISVKNGGGIRDQIGVSFIDGGTNELIKLPPQANPAVGKEEGDISELDISNSLRFDNVLSLADITAQGIKDLAEHFVAAWSATSTPGQFGQIGGFSFSFDPDNTPIVFERTPNGLATGVLTDGDRIVNLVLTKSDGTKQIIVENGELQVDANQSYKMVILDFLANGGDGYPSFYFSNVTKLSDLDISALPDNAPGLTKTGEQDALGEYLAEFYPDASKAFNQADTPIAEDTRIQNLNFRDDTILEGITPPIPKLVNGTTGDDIFDSAFPNAKNFIGSEQILFTGEGADIVDVSQIGENNRIDTGSDNDIVFSGSFNRIILGEGNDSYFFSGGKGGDRLTGGEGNDQFWLLTDQNLLPETINQIGDFNNKFDVIGFANTDFNLSNKGTLWNYQQNGNNVIISAFNQPIAQLLNTTIYDNNFVFG